MNHIRKQLLNGFEIYLEKNQNFWRTSRITTFIDLIIVELNKYEKTPSEIYIENISNYLLAPKINIRLGVIPITNDLSDIKIEDLQYIKDLAKDIIESVFSKVDNNLLQEDFNLYKELVYLRSKLKLDANNSNNAFESEFIEQFYLKIITHYIKEYFS